MKKIPVLFLTILCITFTTFLSGCEKDGDGKIEMTSEHKPLPKRPTWTVDGVVKEGGGDIQSK